MTSEIVLKMRLRQDLFTNRIDRKAQWVIWRNTQRIMEHILVEAQKEIDNYLFTLVEASTTTSPDSDALDVEN